MKSEDTYNLWRGKFEAGLDILFPQSCAFCHQVCSPIPQFPGICRPCLARLPLRGINRSRLDLDKISMDPELPKMDIYCAADYQDPLRQALLRMKFSDAPDLAVALSALLIHKIRLLGLNFSSVAAVPLHPSRLRERGYNQAGLLAKNIARQLSLPDFSDLLCRNRPTDRQSNQADRDRRMFNLSGAFSLVNDIRQKNNILALQKDLFKPLLLVDDILTTGITLLEAASPLRKNGFPVTGIVVASNH